MGWKLLGRPATQRVTKKLATQFAEMEPAPHDRPLSERRLQVYAKLLNDGLFRPVTWASALCKETEDVYRVNGKHTSVLLSGLEKMPEFFVTIEEYECDTLEDVARLYSTFDSGMQSRSAKDIYLSFAATCPEIMEIKPKAICSAAAGIAYGIHGENVGTTQPAERAEALLEHSDFVVWLDKLLTNAPTKGETGATSGSKCKAIHLYRQPVVGAMFQCFCKAKAAATEFWNEVRDETGPKPDAPSRKIARWLITSTLSQREHSKIRPATNRETFVKCIHAWNAWRKNESTNLTYYADKKIPALH